MTAAAVWSNASGQHIAGCNTEGCNWLPGMLCFWRPTVLVRTWSTCVVNNRVAGQRSVQGGLYVAVKALPAGQYWLWLLVTAALTRHYRSSCCGAAPHTTHTPQGGGYSCGCLVSRWRAQGCWGVWACSSYLCVSPCHFGHIITVWCMVESM